MKICENCRMEYGDDNSFCPYCDERYGVVISENDVISADFPKYSEEFPPIGETCVNEKSFTANRNEIYKRNMLLSVMEENIPEQNEAVEPHKSVKVLHRTDSDGEIIIYAKRDKAAEIFNKIKQSPIVQHLNFGNIFCLLAITAIFIYTGKSWYDDLNASKPSLYPPFPEYYENVTEEAIPQRSQILVPSTSIIVIEDGLEMKLTYYKEMKTDNEFCFDFELTNYTGNDIDNFWEKLTDSEYKDILSKLYIIKYNGWRAEFNTTVQWENGIPDANKSHTLKANETIEGYVILNLENVGKD